MYKPPQQREDLQEIRDAEGKLLLRVNAANFRKLERLLRHEEVCGIVSGVADPAGSREPLLEEFTPVAIPWTPNPKGLLEVDKGTLALLMAPFRSPIGFFRYVRQASVEITAEDTRLLNLIFGPDAGVLVLVQSAFGTAPLRMSLPALTAAQPLAGIACGVGFLGDRLHTDAGALAWEAAGLACCAS